MKIPTYIALALIGILSLVATGCTSIGAAKDLDPATGRIKSNSSMYGETKATVLKSEKVDLSKYRSLMLTLGNKYFKEQTLKIGYFEKVVDRQDMEKLLIQEGKSDIVSDVTNLLSWKKIADAYKPFLVLKPEVREEGRSAYAQLKVIQANTATEVFIAEVKMDFMWKGVNDDTVYYPLYNAFLDWLNASK